MKIQEIFKNRKEDLKNQGNATRYLKLYFKK